MKVTINVVNAFIDGAFGGNPAGVVLDADALTDQQRLTIAKTVGLSETAFVSASSVADFKLDFLPPAAKSPIAIMPPSPNSVIWHKRNLSAKAGRQKKQLMARAKF